jgi:hypothetical protein
MLGTVVERARELGRKGTRELGSRLTQGRHITQGVAIKPCFKAVFGEKRPRGRLFTRSVVMASANVYSFYLSSLEMLAKAATRVF